MEPWHAWSDIGLLREPARTLRRRFAAGQVVRLLPGWFVEASVWDALPEWDKRQLVAHVFALAHPGIALADSTALAARGLPTFEPRGSALHVQRPGARPRSRAVQVRSGTGRMWRFVVAEHSHDDPVEVVDGVLTVVPVEAGTRVAAGQDIEAAIVALDGVRRHLVMKGRSDDEVRQGLAALHCEAARRRALDAWENSTSASESAGETLARVRMIRLGFEAPELQWVITADGHQFRPDYAWRSLSLLGEFDGQSKYASNEAGVRRAEKEREEALRRVGYRVFRLCWADLATPHSLRKALSANGVPPAERDEHGRIRRFR